MAKAKSKTAARSRRAPGVSSRSRSSAKGLDHKQQSALARGGSLAQRNDQESRIGPLSDIPDEITAANPPTTRETGRASSPMFDEKPFGGKERDMETARKPRGQHIKAGADDDAREVATVKTLDDLPPGTTIEIRAVDIIAINAAIAGGSRRTFVGTSVKHAIQLYNDFAENGPELVPTGRTKDEEKEFQNTLKQADQQSAQRAKEAAAKAKTDAG